VKFSVRIGDHDYGYRVKQIKNFLTKRDTVLVTVQFKGREITHYGLGEALMARLLDEVSAVGRTTVKPVLKGKSLQVLVLPK
jgi:translation initiation factor IF-3